MTIWRITPRLYASKAFDGEGASLGGGRWNRIGARVVYTSGTLALAALEYLVNLPTPEPPSALVAIPVAVPDAVSVVTLDQTQLPRDWQKYPPSEETQRLGTEWVQSGRSAVLSVPSVVISSERNYVLNPAQPDFSKLQIGRPEPFSFDPRLWGPATRRRV